MKQTILFLIGIVFCMPIWAQQGTSYTMAGTVLEETGEPAIGVSIYLKDRIGVGTVTDVDGRFSIRAQNGDVLVFSYLGYETIEHRITKEEKDMQIRLETSRQQLDEVVIVGMGSKRKASQVAALSTVDASQLQVPVSSVANLMGGRIAGVISMMSSGEPGKNIADFWIRGIGTFGYNKGALILIDGLEGDLNAVDPADIESFSVLKDASATAIYGVRGANGVVIITTKKGVAGKLSITARANVTLSHLKRLPDYLGSYDYAMLANEARAVRGDTKLYSDIEMDIIKRGLDPDIYPDISWQDAILNKNSLRQNYYVSARGGGEVSRYFISLGGSTESAAYKVDKSSPYSSNVGYNTFNYRLNLDLSLTTTTTVYVGSEGFLSMRNSPGVSNTDDIWAAQTQLIPLLFPLKYSTGEFPSAGSNTSLMSPYVAINYTGRGSEQEYKGKATLRLEQKLDFITEGLEFRIQGAYDIESKFEERRLVLPSLQRALGRNANGELILTEVLQAQPANYGYLTDQYRKYYLKSTLTYNKLFAEDHRISVLANYEVEDNHRAFDANREDFGLNENLRSIPSRYMGLAGWINYSFRDTYLLDLNVGYTGTENFQPGRQFGWFPAVGIGWVPTAYEWTKEKFPWLDYLKIRGTIGSVGNDRIDSRRFPYLTLLSSDTGDVYGSEVYYVGENIIGADNLNWEKSVKSDLGIEMDLFNYKVHLIVDWFQDKRDGIFQERVQIPSYTGLVSNPYGNVGKMKSHGADGTASYIQDITKDISLTVRGNFSYSKNTVENWEQVYPKYSYQELNGFPGGTVRGFQSLGFFKDDEDILYSPKQSWNTVMPGDIKYMDVNGDGKIDDDDMVPLSFNPAIPNLMYGFGTEVRYKNLMLQIMFKGTGRNDYYIVDPDGEFGAGGYGYIPFREGEYGNVLSIANDPRNRWIPYDYAVANGIDPALAENPNAEFPRLQYGDNLNNRQVSDFWRRDARYLKLEEVTFTYTMRNNFLKKCGISSVDLQLIGSNLLVWSPTKLFDPEQARYNGRKYPLPARYTFQVYINL